ncbi:MAG: helix-turn-helix transcriptional regulator [Treponema sp.]|nr:helix-turn-helix transcriptional regulator [Treponema sp.]
MEIWERINLLIKENNTTQNAVSVDCGFNPRRIQNLSAGNRLPDAIEITKIAQALGTSVEYLVTGSDNSPYMEENAQLKDRIQKAVEILTN